MVEVILVGAHPFVTGEASRDSPFVVLAAAEGLKAAVAISKELQKAEALP